MLRAAFIMLCIWAFLPGRSYGQENRPWAGFGVEANLIGGRLFRHTEKFNAPMPALSSALDINLSQQTWGSRPWHGHRNFPVIGLGLTYTSYGIDSVYGVCMAVYPNLEFTILKRGKLSWTLRAGFGGGYVTRPYSRHPQWDTLNVAIGSRLNNFTHFVTDLRYRLNNHVDIQAGANFSHVSNASFRQPNLGINMYGAHLGLRYYPAGSQVVKRKSTVTLPDRLGGMVRVGITAGEGGFTDGPLYPVYLASAYGVWRWKSYNKLLAGIDYSYHDRIYAFLKNNEIHIGEESRYSWKASISVGNEFVYGRFGLILQAGVYVKEAYLKLAPFYQRLGLQAYLVQNGKGAVKDVFLYGLLKTHMTQAEMGEYGLGIGF